MWCVDHKGNRFRTEKEMCDFYNIKYRTYLHRKKEGWETKDILELGRFGRPQREKPEEGEQSKSEKK